MFCPNRILFVCFFFSLFIFLIFSIDFRLFFAFFPNSRWKFKCFEEEAIAICVYFSYPFLFFFFSFPTACYWSERKSFFFFIGDKSFIIMWLWRSSGGRNVFFVLPRSTCLAKIMCVFVCFPQRIPLSVFFYWTANV